MGRRRNFFMVVAAIVACVVAGLGAYMYRATGVQAEGIIKEGDNTVRRGATAELDLGTILAGEKATATLNFENGEERPLTLASHVGCGCTSVSLSRTVVPPGERFTATISFDSAVRSRSVGPVTEQFVLLDKAGEEAESVLNGTVKVMVLPSLTIDKEVLAWSILPSDREPAAKIIRLTNEIDAPMAVEVSTGGLEEIVAVEPSKLTLAPKESANMRLSVDPKKLMSGAMIEPVQFHGITELEGKRIELTQSVEARIVPSRVVTAVPGSLIFSKDDVQQGAAKLIELRAHDRRNVQVKEVKSADERIKVVRKDGMVYEVTTPSDVTATISKVIFTVEVDGGDVTIEVPIIIIG